MTAATVASPVTWLTLCPKLRGYLAKLQSPEAPAHFSPCALQEMGATLAEAALWAREASARKDAARADMLPEYRALLAELQTAIQAFGQNLTRYQDHLRSEAGHMRAAEAWVRRSRQIEPRA